MYLIDTGDFAITVDDIRKAIGLETDTFDALIDNGIASICIRSPRPLRTEVWMVEDGKEIGNAVSVGPLHQWNGKWYRHCAYDPDLTLVDLARRKILRWVEDQDDIMRALADQKRRTPKSAKAVLGLVAASMPEVA